jgi:hypothetical protein
LTGMWRMDQKGAKEFALGKESWAAAASAALDCSRFAVDVDEELVADDERSCYNCRYRRWSASSFTCQGL